MDDLLAPTGWRRKTRFGELVSGIETGNRPLASEFPRGNWRHPTNQGLAALPEATGSGGRAHLEGKNKIADAPEDGVQANPKNQEGATGGDVLL